jgi:hypothetical protein
MAWGENQFITDFDGVHVRDHEFEPLDPGWEPVVMQRQIEGYNPAVLTILRGVLDRHRAQTLLNSTRGSSVMADKYRPITDHLNIYADLSHTEGLPTPDITTKAERVLGFINGDYQLKTPEGEVIPPGKRIIWADDGIPLLDQELRTRLDAVQGLRLIAPTRGLEHRHVAEIDHHFSTS